MELTGKMSEAEQGVLERIIGVRNRILLLRKDRNNYYKSEDVLSIYQDLVDRVAELHEVRSRERTDSDEYVNRVDEMLDDCFQLISLFYMALGKKQEMPAMYVQLVAIKQNLDMYESGGVYTREDITPYEERLKEIEEMVEYSRREGGENEELLKFVERKLRQNKREVEKLGEAIEEIGEGVEEVYKEIVRIKKRLLELNAAYNGKGKEYKEVKVEVMQLQRQLLEIDDQRIEGRFVDERTGVEYKGQATVVGALEESFEMVHDLLAEGEAVSEEMKPLYDRLVETKQQLEKLVVTRRWTLRETDLWSFQVQLQEIDGLRTDGQFVDSEGRPLAGAAQGALNYLLHKCYSILYKLLSSSEPVAESLKPIHNQLRTLRRCLVEIKRYGGPFTARDMYPYQMKLFSIDGLRTNGKFMDDRGNIPEGQTVILSLLNECYDIVHELIANNDVEE